MPLRVFTYGTLQPGGYYWLRLLASVPHRAWPAWCHGRLYALPGHPVGYPALAEGSGDETRVAGWVLEIPPEHAPTTLSRLDQLEGYDPHRSEDSEQEYRRHWEICWPRVEDASTFGVLHFGGGLDSPTWSSPNRPEAGPVGAWVYRMPLSRIEALGGVRFLADRWPVTAPR